MLTSTIYRMRFLVVLIMFLCSCHQGKEIEGTWSVQSKHYRSTIEIIPNKGRWDAKVLYYNDDTQIIKEDTINPYYLYKGIKYQKSSQYVDGVSGATKLVNESTKFKLVENDTLIITTQIRDKKINELWIRK